MTKVGKCKHHTFDFHPHRDFSYDEILQTDGYMIQDFTIEWSYHFSFHRSSLEFYSSIFQDPPSITFPGLLHEYRSAYSRKNPKINSSLFIGTSHIFVCFRSFVYFRSRSVSCVIVLTERTVLCVCVCGVLFYIACHVSLIHNVLYWPNFRIKLSCEQLGAVMVGKILLFCRGGNAI